MDADHTNLLSLESRSVAATADGGAPIRRREDNTMREWSHDDAQLPTGARSESSGVEVTIPKISIPMRGRSNVIHAYLMGRWREFSLRS